MRLFSTAAMALAAASLFAADPNPPAAATPALVEEIVAKVNSDIITRGDLSRSRDAAIQEARDRQIPALEAQKLLADRERDGLRDKIDQLLLAQKGKEGSINIDQEFTRYVTGLQKESGLADPDKFHQWVEQRSGQRWEDFAQDAKDAMLQQRVVRQEVASRIQIPLEEQKKYYEEHKTDFVRKDQVFLREILVSTDKKDEAGRALAEKKAQDLVARARRGDKFDELARDNSDAQTAKEGGSLGGWERGQLDKRIEDNVFAKVRGDVTDPIKVPSGWLILKIDDHIKPGQATFEEASGDIVDVLSRPRLSTELRTYLTRLRKEAFLEIKSAYVDTGAAPGKNTTWQDPAQLKPETITKAEVANQKRRKKAFGIPIPGTSSSKIRKQK